MKIEMGVCMVCVILCMIDEECNEYIFFTSYGVCLFVVVVRVGYGQRKCYASCVCMEMAWHAVYPTSVA